MSFRIRQANADDVATVTELIHSLLTELSPQGVVGPTLASVREAATRVLRKNTDVWIVLAVDDANTAVGVITLNECTAIYAGGKFGTISEFYIEPEFRSSGIGSRLLNEGVRFGRERKWERLEVGAPSVPPWARTVAFYKNNGFVEIGPRLKLLLD